MATPLYDFKLADEQLHAIGLLMVTCAHIENLVDQVLGHLRVRVSQNGKSAYPKEMMKRKLAEIGHHLDQGLAPEIRDLFDEFQWAMNTVQYARNMIAHGILLYDEEGTPSLWSQTRSEELMLADAIKATPLANYASHVAAHMHWKLWNIKPHKPMPPRPQ